jgi:hypothetical protein
VSIETTEPGVPPYPISNITNLTFEVGAAEGAGVHAYGSYTWVLPVPLVHAVEGDWDTPGGG